MPRRPPFKGIHEHPPARAAGGPHEGGGRYRPYGEDWFQRIMDVNWPRRRPGLAVEFYPEGIGGTFVSGDNCCFIRYCKLETLTTAQPWQGLGAFDFLESGHIGAASYAKINGLPTFLMGGNNDLFHGVPFGAVIMVSHDGLAWTSVFSMVDALIEDLYWNPQDELFYVDVLVIGTGASAGQPGVWSSPDGITWTGLPGDWYWDHVLFDENGQQNSDGFVGYDAANHVRIVSVGVSPSVYVVILHCIFRWRVDDRRRLQSWRWPAGPGRDVDHGHLARWRGNLDPGIVGRDRR